MRGDRHRVIATGFRDTLGEGPVWLADRGRLAWVDIVSQVVHQLDIATGLVSTLSTGEPIGWVLPRSGGVSIIAGFKSGLAYLDLENGARTPLFDPEPDRPQNRLNDAKVDPHGRIWFGSKDDSDELVSGALYRLDPDLGCQRLDDGYGVANGPAFSPDGATLYHSDSAARTIFAFDLEQDGALSNKRVWLRFAETWGYPDGMTTDAEGCVWVAHWGGGALSRFDPEGRRIDSIALPATNITSCAFAGEGLSRMFVTSSSIGCESEPLAGALFEVDAGVAGWPSRKFAD